MKLSRLVTYSFAPNVGPKDRIFRLTSGLLIAILPWVAFSLPTGTALIITIFGILWLMTGVISRCSIYYMFGLSTAKPKRR